MSFAEIVRDAAASSGFASLTLSQIVMLLLCFVLFYLAIVKKFEPLLLVPIAFGILLANLPNTGLMNDATAAAAQQLTAAQEALRHRHDRGRQRGHGRARRRPLVRLRDFAHPLQRRQKLDLSLSDLSGHWRHDRLFAPAE